MAENGNRGWLQWGTLIIAVLAVAFALYGRLVTLEIRMDTADTDRQRMENTLDRIEQQLARIAKPSE